MPRKHGAYHERGCDLGNGWACETLAYPHMGLEAEPTDPEKVRTYGERACAHAGRCELLRRGVIMAERARLTAEHGALGAALLERYTDFDPPARAMARRARHACRSGHPDGCIRLGRIYDNGDNDFIGLHLLVTSPDWADALVLHACEQGSARGCYAYAERYRYRGARDDPAKAARYFAKACQMGHAYSCEQ